MNVIPARREDTTLIGESIVEAIGEEVANNLAGANHTLDDVKNMFSSLASREDTQYSYRNTLVAVDDSGRSVGVCVAYDGALLHELRKPFFKAVTEKLGLVLDDVEDECEADEFYIDTLAVLPAYRGKGVATALLKATIDRAAQNGKLAGLLVEKSNTRARSLYEHVGFVAVGERPFVHIVMDHMQYPD